MKKILMLITAIGTVYVSHASQVSPVPADGANTSAQASWLSQQQPMQTRSFEQQQVGLQGQGGLWQAVQDWWNGRSTTTPSSVNTSSRWNSSSWYKPSSR